MTQREFALELGITHHVYRQLEHDERSGTRLPPRLGRLTQQERLLLLRHRSGLTMVELEEKLGCSRYWIWKMESGRAPDHRLRMFWRIRKS